MKIAITGGNGFLASAIADKLQDKHDITAIYRSGEVSDKVKHICADITDKIALYNALKGFDVIINTAANKYVDRCEQTPTEAINNNIIGAQNVLEVACAYGIKVIHISTDKAVKPNSVYGASKLIAERLALYGYATVVRLCNLKGSTGSIIPKFKRLAAQGLPIVVH
ncbi:MAG: polysaccharide biosynthesis protein, partial [Clostridia bacterium]